MSKLTIKNITIITLLLILPGCMWESKQILREKLFVNIKTNQSRNVARSKNNETPTTITVWIHGTQLFPRAALKNTFHSPHGLIPATQFEDQYHLRMIVDTLANTDPVNFPLKDIYLFGWSGALDFKERARAARELNFGLQQLGKSYEQRHGHWPRFRLITHSHGGSVALDLARCKNKEKPIIIDELILLACPVQIKTAHLIKDPMFKEKIVLYSSLDLVQILDPQKLYKDCKKCGKIPFFSERRFPAREDIIQVKMKLDGRALFHSDFIRLKFITLLPEILEKLREWQKRIRIEELTSEQVRRLLCIYTKGH